MFFSNIKYYPFRPFRITLWKLYQLYLQTNIFSACVYFNLEIRVNGIIKYIYLHLSTIITIHNSHINNDLC